MDEQAPAIPDWRLKGDGVRPVQLQHRPAVRVRRRSLHRHLRRRRIVYATAEKLMPGGDTSFALAFGVAAIMSGVAFLGFGLL